MNYRLDFRWRGTLASAKLGSNSAAATKMRTNRDINDEAPNENGAAVALRYRASHTVIILPFFEDDRYGRVVQSDPCRLSIAVVKVRLSSFPVCADVRVH